MSVKTEIVRSVVIAKNMLKDSTCDYYGVASCSNMLPLGCELINSSVMIEDIEVHLPCIEQIRDMF